MMRLPFDLGPFHYDEPPQDRLGDLEQLRSSGAVRFANELRGWIEAEEGRILRYGHTGRGWMGVTKLAFGPARIAFPAIAFPELRPEPTVQDGAVRFVQTTGGRVAIPMPRPVSRKPFVQIMAPLVWTTLALTIHADGSSEHEVVGASQFPRHWIYDHTGALVKKSGLADFKTWQEAYGEKTPWGAEDSPAIVTEVETALERELSRTIMRGGEKPRIKKVAQGGALVKQDEPGEELFLLLDGVLEVDVDGKVLAETGPGAILGERALLEGGKRTATLRAVTPIKVAVAWPDQMAPEAMVELARGHRREDR